MDDTNAQTQDLSNLLHLLTDAVSTLGSCGVDSYRDLYLYVSGYRGEEAITEIAVEQNRFWLSAAGQKLEVPHYIRADAEANRRSLLIAEMCYAMWHWRVGDEEMAGYLGCGTHLFGRWIADARKGGEKSVLPTAIANDVRRMAIVESERIILGIPDGVVGDWVRQPRKVFDGRSVLDLLFNDGEVGFRRIQMWMLNGIAAASSTVH